MKIISFICRTAARSLLASILPLQTLTGIEPYSLDLKPGDQAFETDLSSILRSRASSASVSAASDPVLYQITEPHEFDLSDLGREKGHQKSEVIAAATPAHTTPSAHAGDLPQTVLINFNNVSMVEYVRFVSRISNRNFTFDENDLQFNVTIISEEPATIENIMAALMQELRIHDLMLIEDNNNLIIHKNPKVNSISKVVSEENPYTNGPKADLITQVFRLNTLDSDKAVLILRPLISEGALVESLKETNQVVVTDITVNVEKISTLLKSLDAPNSGLVIGQYVSRLTPIDTLILLVQQIMQPISSDQPLTFVPQPTTNSIFIVSSPFLVERTISILEYLDQDQGATRILNLKDLRLGGAQVNPREPLKTGSGQWVTSPEGNWIFRPETTPPVGAGGAPGGGGAGEGAGGAGAGAAINTGFQGENPPVGSWTRDYQGAWNFNPGIAPLPGSPAPKGHWVKDKDGNWVYQLDADETFNPSTLNRQFQGQAQLPGGVQKSNKFYIYKLQYRKGDSVEPALRQIAETIQQNERGSEDFVTTLRSVQWLTAPNSLVFSGTEDNLMKTRELVKEIDTPMRQVFIEMLILETTLIDSLNYGVSYITEFAGGNTTGAQSFLSGASPLSGAFAAVGVTGLGGVVGNAAALVPDAGSLVNSGTGFNLGVIGQKITHCGTEFGSIGALVNALHDRTKDKVISTPKLLVEDNSPAELFVGLNTPYRTQSIANDFGSVITSNYEYIDVGTRLKVTPYIGNGDIIALDIEEEVSTIVAGLITNATTASTSPGPTTRIHRTTTRAHVPDNYFLVISGMMQNEASRERTQVPCLGGVPILGAALSNKTNADNERNLMIFLRPKIVDTEEEIQTLTKHQQDIYDYGNCLKNYDEYEVVEALDLLNIAPTLHPEDVYECDLP